MTNAELRARIRDLIASGNLPDEQPVVQNAEWVSRVQVRGAVPNLR